jgi:hypothetical protein
MNKFKKWKVKIKFNEFYPKKFFLCIYLETFSDSESLSRKNLAHSILAKEREGELKREHEVRI